MNRLWSPRLMVDLVEQVDERGLAISPTLPEGCKNLLIDIDGTICDWEAGRDYTLSNPHPERIKFINKLYDEGKRLAETLMMEYHRSYILTPIADHIYSYVVF